MIFLPIQESKRALAMTPRAPIKPWQTHPTIQQDPPKDSSMKQDMALAPHARTRRCINSDALHSGARKKRREKGTTGDCIKKSQRASTKKRSLRRHQAPNNMCARNTSRRRWGGQGPFSARAQSLGAKRRWGPLLWAQAITRHQEILSKCLSSDEGASKYLACSSLSMHSTHPCLPTLFTSFQKRWLKNEKRLINQF